MGGDRNGEYILHGGAAAIPSPQGLRQCIPTAHRSEWTSNRRTKISISDNFSRFDYLFGKAVGTIGVSWERKRFSAVRRRAFLRAEGIGLSKKQVDLCTAAKMATAPVGGEPEKYTFGQWKIDAREVFLITEHCYCFVNISPVVPGHILTRFSPNCWIQCFHALDEAVYLTAEEVTDLWLTAQRVGQKLEPFFEGSSLTLAIQDGPEAGQTVPHVHVHVLPRKKKDFENNDEIYDELDKKEKDLNEELKKDQKHLDDERKNRSREEMFEEAAQLRVLFL
ncbi:hypothetical protein R1flu_022263 [Riccia fluitans]|uniref:HIT domain-containing protein n=1 Tax=Riccia fluitans TaxID=41844 RepID=A0ABD1ZRQ4_9MARC